MFSFSIVARLLKLGYAEFDIDGLSLLDPSFKNMIQQPRLLTKRSEKSSLPGSNPYSYQDESLG